MVLIENRQIVDLDELHVEVASRQLGNSLRELPVEGFAAIAAYDHSQGGVCHNSHSKLKNVTRAS